MFTALKSVVAKKSLGNAGIETLAYLDHIVCHFLWATRPHSTWSHERAAQMTSSAPAGTSAVVDQSILQSQWETIPTSYARHTRSVVANSNKRYATRMFQNSFQFELPYWNKTRGLRLTTNWDTSQRCAVCHHAGRSAKWTMWIR
jgi:hypothetical protein